MAKKRSALGKGLSALIPESNKQIKTQKTSKEGMAKIKAYEIHPNPNQPRKYFNQQNLDNLAFSIQKHGMIQPIVVRPVQNGYVIVAGERRWRACRQAKINEIPCIIKDINEQQHMEMALIENLQREDLNPIEEALAYQMLMKEYALTQEKLAVVIGKSRPYIANMIRLLQLNQEVKKMVTDGLLTTGHARALLRIEDEKLQSQVAQKIVEEDLSVRQVESLIKKLIENQGEQPKEPKAKDHGLMFLEDLLKNKLGTKVNIVKGKKKGKIEIEYYSDQELDRIIEILQGNVS